MKRIPDRKRIEQKAYTPLRQMVPEKHDREVDITKDFAECPNVLVNLGLVICNFVTENPKTTDKEVLCDLNRIREDPLHAFSRSEDAFALMQGISMGLQQKRISVNKVYSLLDWLIQELEGTLHNGKSHVARLEVFFNVRNW